MRSAEHFSKITFSMVSVNHYHQKPGAHPWSTKIPAGFGRVELMTGGRGWVDIEGEWREVRPGDLIWNARGDNTIGRSDFENPYSCLAVIVKGRETRPKNLPRVSAAPSVREACDFTDEVVSLFKDPAFDRAVLGHYVISRLHLWSRLHQHRAHLAMLPVPIQGVLEWIADNYHSSCSIKDMARRVGWSEAYLHENFQRHLGTTPHRVLMKRRLRAVQEQLVSTSFPVKQIAADCGFADAAALGHLFKKALGCTPGEYRNRYLRFELKDESA